MLEDAELERSVYDADADFAAGFMRESQPVMTALEQRLGRAPHVEHLAEWADVEAEGDAGAIILERRTWTLPQLTVVATLEGVPGHHPGVVLRVKAQGPRT